MSYAVGDEPAIAVQLECLQKKKNNKHKGYKLYLTYPEKS